VQDVSWEESARIEAAFQDDILRWAEDNRDDDVSDEIRKVCKSFLCTLPDGRSPTSLHSTHISQMSQRQASWGIVGTDSTTISQLHVW
jgi:hypothetical protein